MRPIDIHITEAVGIGQGPQGEHFVPPWEWWRDCYRKGKER